MQAIEKRNKASSSYRLSPSPSNCSAFKSARYEVKKLVKDAKTDWTKIKFAELENTRDDPISHWKAIRELQAGFQYNYKLDSTTRHEHCVNGTVTMTVEQNAEFASQCFCKNVFNRVKKSSFDSNAIKMLPRYSKKKFS